MADEQDPEFLDIFLMEAWDTVATLEDGLGHLASSDAPPAALVDPLLVVAHRLKGAAALHGFPGVSTLAGAAEQMLDAFPQASAAERRRAADFLGDLVVFFKEIFNRLGANHREDLDEIAVFRARHADAFTSGGPVTPEGEPPAPTFEESAPGLVAELDRFFGENADVLAYFRPEAAEHLEAMTNSLLALERTGESEEQLATLFRAVHTLKGAAYTVGCAPIGDLAHRIEDLLVAVREGQMALDPSVIEGIFAGIDALKLMAGVTEGTHVDLPVLLERAMAGLVVPASIEVTAPTEMVAVEESEPAAITPALEPPRAPREVVSVRSRRGRREPEPARPAIRPRIQVELDRLDSIMALVGELLVARTRLDQRLLELERVDDVLQGNQARMSRVVRDFEGKHPYPPLAGSRPHEDSPTSVFDLGGGEWHSASELFAELEFDRYDDFNLLARRVEEISADLAEIQAQIAALLRTIRGDAAQIQRLSGRLRNEITRARMVPIGSLFSRFGRPVREAAKAAGKSVRLEVSGEMVEIDNAIIEQIADPLLHMIQNAISHGIEPEDERPSRGKSPQGTVNLRAYHQGSFVYVEVEDDGGGIDVELVRAHAVNQGFVRADVAASLSDAEALDLIFIPGFTTAPQVTATSGRGVGMDVVRTNVSRLNGEIEVVSQKGVGTRFTIKLPLTIITSDALMVRVGGQVFAISPNMVKAILMLAPEQIHAVGGVETVRLDEENLDVIRLDRILGLAPGKPGRRVPMLVLRSGGRSAALAVDELLGKEEIVIKSLRALLEDIGPFAGATISSEGRVTLLLDPVRLLDVSDGYSAASLVLSAPPAEVTSESRRILLVDDSISVRKFVGQMLQKAGFEVTTATDGADAIRYLGENAVDVVITDLEMPRVNGYELIEDLRRRPATREVPIVVLTTRAGAKHLNLARRLGVKHYVTKPVDEKAFVRLIHLLALHAPDAMEFRTVPR